MQSFEVVSGDSCESWYTHNVKVGERNVKYLAIIITTSIKTKDVIGYICSDDVPQ